MTKLLDPFSEVVDEQRRWIPDWYKWLQGVADPPRIKVAGLPPAARLGPGARAFATDATVTTFATAVVGGGTNFVPVYSDGTVWRIG
jgi:hypothetical protein